MGNIPKIIVKTLVRDPPSDERARSKTHEESPPVTGGLEQDLDLQVRGLRNTQVRSGLRSWVPEKTQVRSDQGLLSSFF